MAKRLLLTGAGGFIAGSILAQMPPGWDVVAQSRGGALSERDGLQWRKVDPLQASALDALLMEVQPHAILHTAAIAAIDYCQQHPAEAVAANVDLTQRIAGYALETGARLVFLSTDNVFDGERGAYREDEPPNPINFYGETKARAEQIVQSVPGAVVARVSVVTGLRVLGAGNSFLNWMVQRRRRVLMSECPPMKSGRPSMSLRRAAPCGNWRRTVSRARYIWRETIA